MYSTILETFSRQDAQIRVHDHLVDGLMGPQRKKSKPNPEASSSQSPSTPQHQTHSHSQSPEEQSQKPPAQNSTKADTDVTTTDPHSQSGKHSTNLDNSSPNGTRPTTAKSEKAPARNSWYNGGSWRAKASPVAQATRESISVAGGATTEALAEGSNQAGRYMHNTLRRSSTFSTKSLAIAASETRVNATGSTGSTGTNTDPDKTNADTTMKPRPRSDGKERPEKIQEDANNHGTDESIPRESGQEPVPEPPLPPIPASENDAASGHSQKPSQSSASWLGWWSRPDGYATGDEKPPQPDIVEAHSTPLPPTPGPAPTNDADTIKATDGDTTPPMSINADQNSITPSNKMEYGSTRSWFGLWSSTQNQEADQPDIQPTEPQQPPDATVPADPPAIEQAKDTPETQKTYSSDNKIKDASPKASSSGWAFWSREQIDELSSTPNGTQRHIGELAVADTPSQSHPEAAQFNEGREQKSKTNQVAKSGSVKEVTRDRSSTLDDASSKLQAKVPSQAGSKSAEAAKALEATKAAAAKGLKPQSRPNLILPSFRDTYSTAYIPSYWERLTQYVGSSLRLVDMPADERHVSITPTLPKVKNAIAIGVHGYFPAPLIQKVLGQPTGTSIRFANYASAAIKNWTEQNQPDTPCEIETVALEGEGFILDRVNTLWKLLLNWLSHLRQADLILVACHSQGVPVAIMLVSKLIQLGCLSPTAKIGICAMAGVNLGPFADYKSRLLGGGSAAELFEFSKPGSKVSQDYANALDVVLRHSVRITYCGSLDDQLVPLEVTSPPYPLTHAQSLPKLTKSLPVLNFRNPIPPLRLSLRLCRRPRARPRLHNRTRGLCAQAPQPRHLRPRPHPRTLPAPRGLALWRRRPFPRLRRPGSIQTGVRIHPRDHLPLSSLLHRYCRVQRLASRRTADHRPDNRAQNKRRTPHALVCLGGQRHAQGQCLRDRPPGDIARARALRDPCHGRERESVFPAMGDAWDHGGGGREEGYGRSDQGVAGLVRGVEACQ